MAGGNNAHPHTRTETAQQNFEGKIHRPTNRRAVFEENSESHRKHAETSANANTPHPLDKLDVTSPELRPPLSFGSPRKPVVVDAAVERASSLSTYTPCEACEASRFYRNTYSKPTHAICSVAERFTAKHKRANVGAHHKGNASRWSQSYTERCKCSLAQLRIFLQVWKQEAFVASWLTL